MPDNNLQPLLDTQQNELAAVASVGDSTDSRNLGVFAANIAILIYIGQANFMLSGWQLLLLVFPFVASAALNFLLMFPRLYKGNVNLADHPEYLALDNESLLLQLISDTIAAIDYNKNMNVSRMRFFHASLQLLIVGIIGILGMFVTIKVWQ